MERLSKSEPKRLIHKRRSAISEFNDLLNHLRNEEFCAKHHINYQQSLSLIVQINVIKVLCRINYNIEHLK